MSEDKDTLQLNDMQKEWRQIVLQKLTHLERGQEDLHEKFSNMQLTYVTMNEYLELKKEVIALKEFRLKFITVITCIQVAGGALVWWLTNEGRAATDAILRSMP